LVLYFEIAGSGAVQPISIKAIKHRKVIKKLIRKRFG
jgi:hypothetical protein